MNFGWAGEEILQDVAKAKPIATLESPSTLTSRPGVKPGTAILIVGRATRITTGPPIGGKT
ncbi:MAG TPA: hypothetical protein VKV24_10055 [Casimicrobiaceae bacterium]|nr:hypothetical protein [Casimicrobiaceae bacterium]